MRSYCYGFDIFYFSEEDRGILTAALREWQNNPYISEQTWEKAEELIIYLCEQIEPEEQENE